MDEVEQSLYDQIGTWLHELAWHCDYPINNSIGLWSFFEAFRENGFDIDVNNSLKKVHFGKLEEVNKEHRFFEASFTYDQLLNGWPRDVRGAPRTFYNSIYKVFDTLGEALKNLEKPFSLTPGQRDWEDIRNSRPREIRKMMETHFLAYFNTHQEHMLMPVSGKAPELARPQLFSRVMQEYPLDVHRFARIRDTIMKEGARSGPCPETLVDMKEWRFGNSYHPSENTMIDYFWGMYLQALQNEKRYPLYFKGSGLRELVASGERAFKQGHALQWAYCDSLPATHSISSSKP